jgi:hypothetical protein
VDAPKFKLDDFLWESTTGAIAAGVAAFMQFESLALAELLRD